MASPQLEQGYLRLANELAEAFSRTKFSAQESKVLWHILRHTYGYNRKEMPYSAARVGKAIGMSRYHVMHTVARLVARKVVRKEASPDARIGIGDAQSGIPKAILSLNKNFEDWAGPTPWAPGMRGLASGDARIGIGGCADWHRGMRGLASDRLAKPPHMRSSEGLKTSLKTSSSKTIQKRGPDSKDITPPSPRKRGVLSVSQLDRFNRWYATYPRKVARGAAEKAWKKIDPDDALTERMIEAVRVQVEWRAAATARNIQVRVERERVFIPAWKHPATWLNQTCWEDEIEPLPKTKAELDAERIHRLVNEVVDGEQAEDREDPLAVESDVPY